MPATRRRFYFSRPTTLIVNGEPRTEPQGWVTVPIIATDYIDAIEQARADAAAAGDVIGRWEDEIPYELIEGLAGVPADRFLRTAANGALEGLTAAQTSNALTAAGALLTVNGTAALPAFSFTSDPDTGMYRIAANTLGVAVNGAEAARFSAAGMTLTGRFNGVTPFANQTEISAIMANLGATEQSFALAGICDLTISQLKATGLWALLAGIWTLWAPNATLARINLKTGALVTNINAAAHVPMRGFLFNGVDQRLEGSDGDLSSSIYEQDSAHLGTWIVESNGAPFVGKGSIGRRVGSLSASGTFWLAPQLDANTIRARLNSGGPALDFNEPDGTSVGFTVVTRGDASNVTAYKDGVSLGAQAQASDGVGSLSFAIGGVGPANFSADLHGAATIGAHLTASQQGALYQILGANRRAFGGY